ncbi:MAG: tetratricopeptide repeat protein [Flavobacteriales bacterium]|nr:tetratricopeptide repeat protein [Flavobacteriales bacterium]
MSYFRYIITFLLFLIANSSIVSASNNKIDSLKNTNKLLAAQFQGEISDTTLINSLIATGNYYLEEQPDSAIEYYKQSINLIEIIRLKNMGKKDKNIDITIDYKLSQIHLQYGLTQYYSGKFIKAKTQYQKTISLLQKHIDNKINNNLKNNFLALKAKSYAQIGNCNWSLSEYNSAFKNYSKALDINIKIDNQQQQAAILGNMGVIMDTQGRYAEALTYYFRSLKIEEEINNEKGQAVTLGNIGIIYYNQKEYQKALDYYKKSLELKEKIKETSSISTILGNIGIVYHDQNNFDKALEYYQKGLAVDKKYNNKYGISRHLGNIGLAYEDKKDLKKALDHYFEALKIDEELNNKIGIGYQKSYIGNLYMLLDNYKKSEKYLKESYQISKEIGSLEVLKSSTGKLSELYEKNNKKELAFDFYKLFIQYRDSLLNEENTKASIEKEMQYLYEKKSVADSLAYEKEKALSKAEIAKQKAELKMKKNQQYALFGGLFLIILFSGFMYNRFRVTNKQKQIIESQKIVVEQKNTEIVDSIKYAKRIQNAILPADELLKQQLKDSFILYHPKDIVSGDFYWLEKHEDQILFAAADCTGHGVPGAMVSVVCANSLSKALLEDKEFSPAKILNKTKQLVVDHFEKSGEDVKDGMDIALCSLKFQAQNSKLKEVSNLKPETAAILQYAGANNPLYIISKNTEGIAKLNEIKPNKQPIGKYFRQELFTNHEIELQKGDTIYVFTDGYADQFGGPKGKKMMYKPFKELLLSIYDKPMEEQKEILNQYFQNWKGSLEQVDDVCVIGVRI